MLSAFRAVFSPGALARGQSISTHVSATQAAGPSAELRQAIHPTFTVVHLDDYPVDRASVWFIAGLHLTNGQWMDNCHLSDVTCDSIRLVDLSGMRHVISRAAIQACTMLQDMCSFHDRTVNAKLISRNALVAQLKAEAHAHVTAVAYSAWSVGWLNAFRLG